jgi:hypothetical protein
VATRYSSVENGVLLVQAEAERERRRWREQVSVAVVVVVWGATRDRGRGCIWRWSMAAAAAGKPSLVGGLKGFCCSDSSAQRVEQNKDRAQTTGAC